MKIIGFDIETTGLDPQEHRLVEFAAEEYDYVPGTEQKLVKSYRTLINPERSIPIEAQRKHRIAYAQVADKPTWSKVSGAICGLLNSADLLVTHNGVWFDVPFINAQPTSTPITRPVFDTLVYGRWAHALGKAPTLEELCFACDEEYDEEKAHGALYDTSVMMACFFKGVKWGFFSYKGIEKNLQNYCNNA